MLHVLNSACQLIRVQQLLSLYVRLIQEEVQMNFAQLMNFNSLYHQYQQLYLHHPAQQLLHYWALPKVQLKHRPRSLHLHSHRVIIPQHHLLSRQVRSLHKVLLSHHQRAHRQIHQHLLLSHQVHRVLLSHRQHHQVNSLHRVLLSRQQHHLQHHPQWRPHQCV